MESIQEFMVGDVVRITRKYKTRQDGWGNSWVDDMDQFVGTTQTISHIDIRGKQCYFKDVSYGWPLAVLELVHRPGMTAPSCTRETTVPKPKTAPDKTPETRVLPSDEAGIEAMGKRMLGQPKSAPPAAPAPQKAPFYKGLLIQASEKYMGLGFNGEK